MIIYYNKIFSLRNVLKISFEIKCLELKNHLFIFYIFSFHEIH
jgi:hypothetical protein